MYVSAHLHIPTAFPLTLALEPWKLTLSKRSSDLNCEMLQCNLRLRQVETFGNLRYAIPIAPECRWSCIEYATSAIVSLMHWQCYAAALASSSYHCIDRPRCSCRQTTIYTVSDCVLGLWASLHRVPLQEKEPGMRVFVYSLIASKSSTVTTSLYK